MPDLIRHPEVLLLAWNQNSHLAAPSDCIPTGVYPALDAGAGMTDGVLLGLPVGPDP